MKSSLFLIIFFFLVSCSSNPNLEIDIENLKKEGQVILNSKSASSSALEEIYKISQVKINNTITNKFLLKSDLEQNNINIKKQSFFKSNDSNPYKKNILSNDDNIIFIDDY